MKNTRLALLILPLLVLSCLAAEPAPAPEVAAGTLFERILELNCFQEPELNVNEARKVFSALKESCSDSLKSCEQPAQKVTALVKALKFDAPVPQPVTGVVFTFPIA